MNTEMTQEQQARATKIYNMAWELGLLMREHADDCFEDWNEYGNSKFPVRRLIDSTASTIEAGFYNADAFAEAE